MYLLCVHARVESCECVFVCVGVYFVCTQRERSLAPTDDNKASILRCEVDTQKRYDVAQHRKEIVVRLAGLAIRH